jgi:hypothetical protein
VSEVGIPSDKLHVVIEAGLRDQRVGQTSAPSVRQQPRAQETGARAPSTVQDFEKGKPKHNIPDITRQAGIAEQFGEDDRQQRSAAVFAKLLEIERERDLAAERAQSFVGFAGGHELETRVGGAGNRLEIDAE